MAEESDEPTTKCWRQSHDVLRESFRQLHEDIVNNVDVRNVVDALFTHRVIGVGELDELNAEPNRQKGCRTLLVALHKSGNVGAFAHLRSAIGAQSNYDWLAVKIDDRCLELARQQATAAKLARSTSETSSTGESADVIAVEGLRQLLKENDELACRISSLTAEVEETREMNRKALEERQAEAANVAEDKEQLANQFATRIELLERSHVDEMRNQSAAFTTLIEASKKDHEEQMKKMKADHEKEMAQFKSDQWQCFNY